MPNTAFKVNTMPRSTAGLPTPKSGWLPTLPPTHVVRAYFLGALPVFVVYLLAIETDGDLSRNFNFWSALRSTLLIAGPTFVLLLPVWAFTGWLERRGFGITRLLLNHGAMSVVFAASAQILSYGLMWAVLGHEAAERGRNQWFIWQALQGMMMYWAAAGGYTAYRAVLKARQDAATTVQTQTLLARTELVALRNKLNPHFLFNTLHSIIALTRKDAASAEKALLMFSDMLRYVLDTEKAGHDDVPLQEELDFTRAYLALEAMRLGQRLNVQWDVDEAATHHAVPALSIQPIVENSIKHAFNPRTAPGHLTVGAKLDMQRRELTVTVADDGPGCAPDVLGGLDSNMGLGLKTVTRRLQLQHGANAGLKIDTQPGAGFKVQFTLPLASDLQD
jgi:signal transduction histidine kinase